MRALALSTVMLLAIAAAVQAQVKPDLAKDYDYIRRVFAKTYVFSECRNLNNPFTEEETAKNDQTIKDAKKTDERNVIAAGLDLLTEVEKKHAKGDRISPEARAAICKELLEFALR